MTTPTHVRIVSVFSFIVAGMILSNTFGWQIGLPVTLVAFGLKYAE